MREIPETWRAVLGAKPENEIKIPSLADRTLSHFENIFYGEEGDVMDNNESVTVSNISDIPVVSENISNITITDWNRLINSSRQGTILTPARNAEPVETATRGVIDLVLVSEDNSSDLKIKAV